MPRGGWRNGRIAWLLGLSIVLAVSGGVWFRWSGGRPDEPPSFEAIEAAGANGRWEDVEQGLLRRLAANPSDGKAQMMHGAILAGQGRIDEAIKTLEGIAEDDPGRGRALRMVGELHLMRRRAAEAEAAWRAASKLDPGAIDPRRRLIHLMGLEQRPGETRELLWEIFRATNEPPVLIDLILEYWSVENDVRGLSPEVDGLLEQSPEDPYLQRARGLALTLEGRLAEALPYLEKAAEALVDDPVGRFALLECRQAVGDDRLDPSILGERPEEPAAAARWLVFLGRLHELRGDDAQALQAYREAVELHPESYEAHYRLGQTLLRSDAAEEGRHRLDLATEIKTRQEAVRDEFRALRRRGYEESAELYEQLGNLCRGVGMNAEAKAWLGLALKVDPGRDSARESLAALEREPSRPLVAFSRPVLRSRSRRSTSEADVPGKIPPLEAAGSVQLEEIAANAGVVVRYDSGATDRPHLRDTMGGGVGLIDYDEDGYLDIYFVNGCPMPRNGEQPPTPNRLFRNKGDGSFEDVTDRACVGGRGYGMGCAVGDYDDDGHDDLYVTGFGQTVLYRNRGDGTFEDVTERAGVGSDRWTTAAGFGDLDRDGDLDLVVVTYVQIDPLDNPDCPDPTGRLIHCSPLRFEAQPDLVFRNNGDGTFTEMSAEAGFDDAPEGRGLGLAIADVDGDGLLDVFVANDLSHDFLFMNRGGFRFEERGLEASVAYNGSGRATSSMGVVADDLDGDGRIDLLVTNFLNEPNTFFRNLGGGLFVDATLSASLSAPSIPVTGFGASSVDLDNDGHLDLFIANGHVDDQPAINSPMAQPPHVYLGGQDGRFRFAPPSGIPYLSRRVVGRGSAAGDLDNDGKVDLVVVHRDAPLALLKNRTPGGNWLGVRLAGADSGRTPVGTRVTCTTGGRDQVRWLTSGTSYLAAQDQRLWFGLGPAERVEFVRVTWPSGLEQTWENVPAKRIVRIVEGEDRLEFLRSESESPAP